MLVFVGVIKMQHNKMEIRLTLKERVKFWFGSFDRKRFGCWVINKEGIGYLGLVDLKEKKFHFKGKIKDFTKTNNYLNNKNLNGGIENGSSNKVKTNR